MVCRGTTAVAVMLALLSMPQAAQSAEPSRISMQQRNIERPQSQTPTRVKITPSENSLKFVIRDPASRSLIGSAAGRQTGMRWVNYEVFDKTPQTKSLLVSQLGEDKARDALDALRAVTDDLDLDLPTTTPDAKPDPVTVVQPDATTDRSNGDVLPPSEVNPRSPVLDALRAEQRKRELQMLLDSVNRSEEEEQPNNLDLQLGADQIEDTQEDANPSTGNYESDIEPKIPEATDERRSDYDAIPWTISGLFDEPEDFDRQCREQEFCRHMWECAGGRSLSPCDRWKRNARRTYELQHGGTGTYPMPIFSGIFIEPLLGYGLFGAPIGGVSGCGAGCGCHHGCGLGCQAGARRGVVNQGTQSFCHGAHHRGHQCTCGG